MSWNESNKHRAPSIPVYGKHEKNVIPGLYLGLFHGYASEEARQAAGGEWGEDGPLIGPIIFMQTTYKGFVKPRFRVDADVSLYRGLWPADTLWNEADDNAHGEVDGGIRLVGADTDLFPAGAMQYGDWTVFNINEAGEVAK